MKYFTTPLIRVILIVLILLYGWWSVKSIANLKETIVERDLTIVKHLDTIETINKNNIVTVNTLTTYYESLLSNAKQQQQTANITIEEFITSSKKKSVIKDVKILTEPDIDSISGLVNRMHEIYRNTHCTDSARCID